MILLAYSPCAECGNLLPNIAELQTALFWLALAAIGIGYILFGRRA
jgi:hypothetical protein